jgi:4'-phosphopantetheinyl transferase
MPSAPVRLSSAPPFELWLVRLASDATDSNVELLDAHERAHAARFHFERDRGRYVAAHAALRRLLTERTGREAATLAFHAGPYGKPSLAGAPRCAFSLSRSDELALIALADDGEIGVDLERVRPLPDLDTLARQCLTSAECRELQALPADARPLALLRRWTRKEACLKALGTGLSIEPSTFAVALDADETAVSIATLHGSVDVLLRAVEPAPGWVGAVARVRLTPNGE